MTYGGSSQVERRQAGNTDFTTSALGLQEADPPGQATYYTCDNSGNLISQRTPSGTHYYILDALGSVVALTDDSGAVVGRYSYEPYGKATHSGTVQSAFQFASGYHDSQTGLVKFGVRYYDPTLGRWTQEDSLGSGLADPRMLNRYGYAVGDPVNRTDHGGVTSMIIWVRRRLFEKPASKRRNCLLHRPGVGLPFGIEPEAVPFHNGLSDAVCLEELSLVAFLGHSSRY